MKKILLFLTALISLTSFSCSSQRIISHEELVDLLDIKQWILPLPKDTRYQWSLDVIDYEEYKIVEDSTEWMDLSREARITFMPVGENSIYRYWFQQNNVTSSGSIRLDLCDNPDDIKLDCNRGQINLHFFKEPIRIGDGKTYLICDLSEIYASGRHKMVILSLTKYRLEDM